MSTCRSPSRSGASAQFIEPLPPRARNCIIFSIFVSLPRPTGSKNLTNLAKFHLRIRKNELYTVDEPLVDILMHDMATKPILHVSEYTEFL